jgi:hypothetical protein
MFRATFILVLYGVALVGCMETGAQTELTRMKSELANANAGSKECLDDAYAKPEYSSIRAKSYFSTTDQNWPLPMLNDDSLPSKEQIKQLYAIYSDIQECRKVILDGASKTHPLLVMAWVQTFSDADKLWSEFTKGRIAWGGKFNEGRKNAVVESQARWMQAAAQINGQLQNQHQGEIEQRQRAAAAFSQWAAQQQALVIQQQAINAANRPRTINCNYIGNSATCNSN